MQSDEDILPRWQRKRLGQRLEERRVLLLAGARQCGKTTLARDLCGADMEYRTLDDPNLRKAAQDDPISFVRHQGRTLIIDEIQRVPDLLPAIKMIVDEDRRPGQFLLTGSANLAAIPQARESLAGRVAKIRLRPLAQGEQQRRPPQFLACAFSGTFPDKVPPTHRDEILRLGFVGGYPEALTLDDEGARHAWHRDYITALLERDLADITHIQRQDAMRKLVRIVAAWSSKLMNIADITAGLAIKRPTVESYLAALEALYLIDRVPPWTKTDYERVGKQDKLFMTDSGLMATILNWRMEQIQYDADRIGKLVETFAYNELAAQVDLEDDLSLYHYRDRLRREIDFLIERETDGAILGIEVKASATIHKAAFKHLKWFRDHLAQNRPFTGIVLYSGAHILSFGEDMIAVPLSALWSGA